MVQRRERRGRGHHRPGRAGVHRRALVRAPGAPPQTHRLPGPDGHPDRKRRQRGPGRRPARPLQRDARHGRRHARSAADRERRLPVHRGQRLHRTRPARPDRRVHGSHGTRHRGHPGARRRPSDGALRTGRRDAPRGPAHPAAPCTAQPRRALQAAGAARRRDRGQSDQDHRRYPGRGGDAEPCRAPRRQAADVRAGRPADHRGADRLRHHPRLDHPGTGRQPAPDGLRPRPADGDRFHRLRARSARAGGQVREGVRGLPHRRRPARQHRGRTGTGRTRGEVREVRLARADRPLRRPQAGRLPPTPREPGRRLALPPRRQRPGAAEEPDPRGRPEALPGRHPQLEGTRRARPARSPGEPGRQLRDPRGLPAPCARPQRTRPVLPRLRHEGRPAGPGHPLRTRLHGTGAVRRGPARRSDRLQRSAVRYQAVGGPPARHRVRRPVRRHDRHGHVPVPGDRVRLHLWPAARRLPGLQLPGLSEPGQRPGRHPRPGHLPCATPQGLRVCGEN